MQWHNLKLEILGLPCIVTNVWVVMKVVRGATSSSKIQRESQSF